VDFVDVELPTNETSEKRELPLFTDTDRRTDGNKLPVSNDTENGGLLTVPGGAASTAEPKLRRSQSRAFLSEDGLPQPIEFFVASDASAVIEHTKRVLYLEDDDIAHINEGG
jgi:glucosamine 6-phosphate synthetase-like amidotransferase/phosphosugar isomerase protein